MLPLLPLLSKQEVAVARHRIYFGVAAVELSINLAYIYHIGYIGWELVRFFTMKDNYK